MHAVSTGHARDLTCSTQQAKVVILAKYKHYGKPPSAADHAPRWNSKVSHEHANTYARRSFCRAYHAPIHDVVITTADAAADLGSFNLQPSNRVEGPIGHSRATPKYADLSPAELDTNVGCCSLASAVVRALICANEPWPRLSCRTFVLLAVSFLAMSTKFHAL
jgi:hypothetical protein